MLSGLEVMGALSGAGFATLAFFFRPRPATIQFAGYTLSTAIGYGLGTYADKILEMRVRRREIYIWDYVSKHPEQFPELTEKKKQYKDILQSWEPVR